MMVLSMILMALLAVYLIWRLGRSEKALKYRHALLEENARFMLEWKGRYEAEATLNRAYQSGIAQRDRELKAARAQKEIAEGRVQRLLQELHVINMAMQTQARRAKELAEKTGSIKGVPNADAPHPRHAPRQRFVPFVTISGRITRRSP